MIGTSKRVSRIERARPREREFLRDHDFFRLGGTFAPAFRACDSPIAIACLRLLTFLPERPLLSVPRLRSRIACLTFRPAFLPYFAMTASPLSGDYRPTSGGCERQNREWPRRAQRRRIARDVQGEAKPLAAHREPQGVARVLHRGQARMRHRAGRQRSEVA